MLVPIHDKENCSPADSAKNIFKYQVYVLVKQPTKRYTVMKLQICKLLSRLQ